MVTASRAHSSAEAANTKNEPDNISAIYDAIAGAAVQGDFETIVNLSFDDYDYQGIQNYLSAIGYNVRFLHKTDTHFNLKINW